MADRKPLLEYRDEAEKWMAIAECRKYPEVDFFPGRGEDTRVQIAICRRRDVA